VSNLKALATFGQTKARGIIMDARRGEVYAAVYDDALQLLSPEVVVALPDWLASLHVKPQEIISPDFSTFESTLALSVPIIRQRTLAAAIARIAESTPPGDPALLDANYVRRTDAELFWVDKA
jgi:tRNA threonylcarbamoyladenosine biosynthesis protein TsaB